MLIRIKNETLRLKDDTMHYIRLGSGSKFLVILPGLGDGLTTVKGTALPMALLYRAYAKDYTVYMFSRRNHLPEGSSTRDMSHDLKEALVTLGIQKTNLVGISMGGMIAQHFAADYPQFVERLVLVVTGAEPTPVLTESISEWRSLAMRGNYIALMHSNVRRIYSEGYYRKNRRLIPIIGRLTKPKSYERFLIQADACSNHFARNRLSAISAPTLIIGGELDKVIGADSSRVLASSIPGARLKIYAQWGHGLYDEASDFHQTILRFLREVPPDLT